MLCGKFHDFMNFCTILLISELNSSTTPLPCRTLKQAYRHPHPRTETEVIHCLLVNIINVVDISKEHPKIEIIIGEYHVSLFTIIKTH